MGFAKVFTPLLGRTPLERIVDALGGRSTILVTTEQYGEIAAQLAPQATIVINREPERGMTGSLRAALSALPVDRAFAVQLGDMPYVTGTLLQHLEMAFFRNSGGVVVYPVDDAGRGGHPVIFSPVARAICDALPDGDTLRQARSHPSLRAVRVPTDERGAFVDIDEPAQWESFDA